MKNTENNRILTIEWCVGNKKYEIHLSQIDSQKIIEKDFIILSDGPFQHVFVTGKAQVPLKKCWEMP